MAKTPWDEHLERAGLYPCPPLYPEPERAGLYVETPWGSYSGDSEEQSIMEPRRELTFGEKAVGLTFNPSGDPTVSDTIDELLALRAENEELKQVYRAGCEQWNPVYKLVLDERDALRARIAKLEEALRGCIESIEIGQKIRNRNWDRSATPSSVLGMARAALTQSSEPSP